MSTALNLPPQVSPLAIQLLKGVLYSDKQSQLWQDLLTFQAALREYLAVIGLQLIIDEAEGYAYLRQIYESEDESSDQAPLPRLVQRRQLSYPISLLCVLLRKKLIEQDAAGGETRVILSRVQIIEMLRVFLHDAGSEARTIDQIDRHINKLIDYGFLRRLKGEQELYEVRRIIKALVDAEWLVDFEQKLADYQTYATTSP